MGVSSLENSSGLVRLCVVGEDKEFYDVVVHEDDTIWTLKIKIFELINVFPGKQALVFKDPDEVCMFSMSLDFLIILLLYFFFKSYRTILTHRTSTLNLATISPFAP
jgi:hypothetical protein